MVNYKCERCGFTTFYRNNFRKHIYRKHTCQSKIKEVNINVIRKNFELTNTHLNINPPIQNSQNNVCKFCNKTFTTYKSKWRHETKYCKVKKETDDMKKQINEMQAKIYDLEKTSNNIIKNSNVNSNNKTIIVNNFGSENLDYITDKMMKRLLLKGSGGIPSLIKQIHFNPKHPENHNVRIKNKKLKFAEIKEDDKWKYKHKKAVLDDLVDFGYITLEEFKDNNEDKLDKLLMKGFNKLMSKYEKKKDQLIENVELEVLNGMNEIESV
jgi:hypothetical protein